MSRWRDGIPAFNAADDETAREQLLVCLDVPRWADEVAAGRPFANLDEIEARMVDAAGTITDDELERALSRHPRIGERADAATARRRALDPRAVGSRPRATPSWLASSRRATSPTRVGSVASSSSARPAATGTRSWPSCAAVSATTTQRSEPRQSSSSPRSPCSASERCSPDGQPVHPRARHRRRSPGRRGAHRPGVGVRRRRRRGGDRRRRTRVRARVRSRCPRATTGCGSTRVRGTPPGRRHLLSRGGRHLHGRAPTSTTTSRCC